MKNAMYETAIQELRNNKVQFSILGVFLLVCLLFLVGSPEVFLDPSMRIYTSFMSTIPFFGIMALAMTFVVILGEIDLSFASVVAVAAWVFCSLIETTGYIWYAAAMALAQGLAIVAGMQSVSIGGGGGGASIGGGGGMPAYTTPTIPELDTGEEEKGRLTIIIQGDFIGDEGYVDRLVEKINQAQEERNVTLIASESRYASEVV